MLPTLAVIAKSPERGRVKTRLAAAIGDDAALSVYRSLLAYVADLLARWEGPVEVFFAGDERALAGSPLGRFARTRQCEGGLGARLAHIATTVLAQPDANGVIVIGADCVEVQLAHLLELATLMRGGRVAIGPALDGGYWAIGMRDPRAIGACLHEGIDWSTERVLAQTVRALDQAGIDHALGGRLSDIDELSDLKRAEALGFRWRAASGVFEAR
ncbi:MAG TPA: TIGR04282 family arsenosugar biosynthesis glycosyltransferase [Planctomycetota bacterium]|nr:TIGR04282 family arsenosugar biosynthesis glycosyltransferase [Planctomycetota bacterium]